MADNIKIMTEKEVQNEIKALKNLFSVVRLLSADDIGARTADCENKRIDGKCYEVWKRKSPCRNCISYRALVEKKYFSKVENTENGLFFVMVDYREVDGKPYVIEAIKEFDDAFIVDFVGGRSQGETLSEYFDKTFKDVLTGVYNRRYYEEYIANERLSGGIAIIDIDDFKIYNDLFGHDVGDVVIKTIADVLKRCVRSDDKVIRYGGDEFLLVVSDINRALLEKNIEFICASVKKLSFDAYPAIKPSISAGYVVCSDEKVKDAVVRADELLYIAKRKKNFTVSDGETNAIPDKRSKLLVVDDSPLNREILSSILKNEYDITEAEGGKQAIEIIADSGEEFSAVLLDLVMPEMSGFEVIDFLNANYPAELLPIIAITGDESSESQREAYDKGVSDYITRPFDAKVVYKRVSKTVKLYARQRQLVSQIMGEIDEREKNRSMLVEILSQVIEHPNDEDCGSHATHMMIFSGHILEKLAKKHPEYGLTNREISVISTAAALHDIGKAAIDRTILDKKGKLTEEEFKIVKLHTILGENILNKLKAYEDEPLMKYAKQICRHHHERFDGKGYPDGLSGDEIPLAAQVVSVCDVYDALISKRPYKTAYSHEQAVLKIKNGECGVFNPLVLECFFECADRFKQKLKEEGFLQ